MWIVAASRNTKTARDTVAKKKIKSDTNFVKNHHYFLNYQQKSGFRYEYDTLYSLTELNDCDPCPPRKIVI